MIIAGDNSMTIIVISIILQLLHDDQLLFLHHACTRSFRDFDLSAPVLQTEKWNFVGVHFGRDLRWLLMLMRDVVKIIDL